MASPESIRNRLLALIAFLLVVGALKWSYPVSMPLAVAIFIVAAAWPIKPWFDRILPSNWSYAATVVCLLLVFAAFVASLYFASWQVVHTFAGQQNRFEAIYRTYASWVEGFGLAMPGPADAQKQLVELVRVVISRTYSILAYIGFVAVLVILGLPEVPALRQKVRERLESVDRRALIETVEEIAARTRRYFGVMTLTSIVTGVASSLWALVMGLDLALLWGVLNFLLNYIPIAGNIIGIVPPTLYAIVQFQDVTTPLVIFAGYALLQILVSYFLYPWLQGRDLSLSPVAVMLALAFWSWVWGIPGALLAVPLTAATVIVCEHFPSTQWIAKLLSGTK